MAKTKKKTKKKISAAKASSKKTFLKKAPPKKAAKKPIKKTVAKKVVKKAKLLKGVSAQKKTAKLKKPKSEVGKLSKISRVGGLPDQLLDAALKVLDERQAEDIFTVELAGKSSMADYLIIASGRASRQLAAIAQYLREAFEKLGVSQIRVEGVREGNWVLIDAGDIIIHLFRPEVRRYYNLESIWLHDGSSHAND